MKLGLVILGLSACFVASADAQHCGYRSYNYRYYDPYYNYPILAVQFAPVYVPTYSIGYNPGVAVQAPAAQPDIRAIIREEVQKLLQPGPLKQGEPGPLKANAPNAGPTGLAKCAACHAAEVAVQDGGGFKLFDGAARVKLTAKEMASLTKHVADDTMPPKNNKKGIAPLTDAEASDILRNLHLFQ